MSLIHLCLYSESLLTFESQEAVELDSLSPFVAGKNEKTCITNSYFILATGKLGPYFCTISCKPQQQKDPRTTYWAMTLSKISKRIGPTISDSDSDSDSEYFINPRREIV